MPWTDKDAARHTRKATTAKDRRAWAGAANDVRARELEKGADEADADAKAVRVANGVVKHRKKR